jgi:hypothetical protein
MNWGFEDMHKEDVTLKKTIVMRVASTQWQDGKSGRDSAFQLLVC